MNTKLYSYVFYEEFGKEKGWKGRLEFVQRKDVDKGKG